MIGPKIGGVADHHIRTSSPQHGDLMVQIDCQGYTWVFLLFQTQTAWVLSEVFLSFSAQTTVMPPYYDRFYILI